MANAFIEASEARPVCMRPVHWARCQAARERWLKELAVELIETAGQRGPGWR